MASELGEMIGGNMFYTFSKRVESSLWWRWCFSFSGTHTRISALQRVSRSGRTLCLEEDQRARNTCFGPNQPCKRGGGSLRGARSGCEVWAVRISHIPGLLPCSDQSIPCSHPWNSVSFPARRKDTLPCYHHVSESLRKDLKSKRHLPDVTAWWQRSNCGQGDRESGFPFLHYNKGQLSGHKMCFCGVNSLTTCFVTLDSSGTI